MNQKEFEKELIDNKYKECDDRFDKIFPEGCFCCDMYECDGEHYKKDHKDIKDFIHKELSLQHNKDIEWFKSIIPEKKEPLKMSMHYDSYADGFNTCLYLILQELDKK